MTDGCCCLHDNQQFTDDGDPVYPDLCTCICHTSDDEPTA
jgi:hypothetical protein